MYAIASFTKPYNYAAAMLCRLYGLPNNTKFSIEWIPLIDACVSSHIMNWPSILSDNLATTITKYRKKKVSSSDNLPPFYFSAYIMDVIYFCTTFPTMGLKWTLQDPYPSISVIKKYGNCITYLTSTRYFMLLCFPYIK